MKRIATHFSALKSHVTVLSTAVVCSLVSTSLAQANASFRLQVLHASDMEADVVSLETAPRFAALVDKLEDSTEVDASVTIAAGDTFIPGAFLSAGNDATTKDSLKLALGQLFGFNANGTATDLRESAGRPDIAILNAIGFDASCIGNHEFDLGSTEFASIILPDVRSGGLSKLRHYGAAFPYLSANLDFSAVPSSESALAARSTSSVLPISRFRANPSTDSTYVSTNSTHIAQHPKIAKSAIIERGTQKIGVLGVTPPDLANISSPGRVAVTGPQGATLTSPRTYDLNALAAHLQPVIDDLRSNGCNKIILATQLQQIENEKGLASKLDGVDIIVAGGSGTIYMNQTANLLPGDSAAGPYPFATTDKNGKTVVIVSTDGQYQYLGRLLVDFNANGDIVAFNGDTIPATAAQVTALWGSDANLAYASGTRGGTVKALTDAVGAVINSKDGLILGKSSVYLEGRRTAVRQQETNFGNLSADANLWYAKQYDATTRVSLKNGGGIRNAIGSTSANGTLQPTKANLTANKTAGDISRLDVEDSLKFNNALTVVTVKASQLKMLLEHGVAGSNGSGADKNTPGQFSQLGGLVAAADLSRTAQTYTSSNNVISTVNAGERIRYVALTDAQGNPTDVIVANGQVLEPDRFMRMVTLNFLANAGSTGSDFGGDNYPFPYISRLNGVESYDRKDLNSGSLTPALPGNFPALSTFAGNGTEQDAFAEYLLAFHSTTPFGITDKTVDLDRRISQITPGSAPQIDAIPKAAIAQAGVPFSYLLTAGNYATAFSSSTLPSWLTLNSTTGLLSGNPPAWGVEDLIVTASNGNGTDTETLRINLRAEDSVFQTIKFLGGASLPTGGEIVDYANGKVLTTNSGNGTHKVEILTISSSGAFTGNSTSVDLSSVFGGAQNINSISSVVADQRGFGVATVIPTGTGSADFGKIAIFNIETRAILKTLDVGYHPDSVAITPDGTKLVVVNEGEYGSTDKDVPETVNRPGSISIVDISSVNSAAVTANLTQSNVKTFDFSSANLANGVSITGLRNPRLDTLTTKTPNPADIEPEYATATNTKAYVTLQENNAIAVFDFATSKYSAIFELGTIEQLIDASDRDGANNTTSIAINDSVHGLPMPDTIANFIRNGSVFLLTANEGDARPDDADIARGSALSANFISSLATNSTYTSNSTGIGRLNFLRFEGDDNYDGKIELPTMMGTRSFTIWNGSNGTLVYDSGSTLEMFAAANDPETFNTNSGSLANTDTRSDDKGPEPEAIAYASLGGRHYAFVGAERQNGIYAFDISDFSKVKVVGYFNTISSTQDSGAAYISPESIKFIRAGTNPSDKNLLVVGYEGTGNNGSVGVFEFAPPASSEPEPTPAPTPTPTPTPTPIRPVPLAQRPVSSATTREEVKSIVSSKVQEVLAKDPVKVKTTGQIAEILGVSKGTLSKIAKLSPGLKTEGGKINIAKLEKLISNNPKAAALLMGNAKIQGGSKKSSVKK
jgi:alkaline phosphatase